MKTEWICKWQLIPGGRKQTAVYSSQSEAREAMAKVLNDAVDLHDHIRALRQEEGEDCGSSAGFLETFLSDLAIPETEAEIPDHFDIPEHCLLEFYANDGFRWSYMRGECPFLSAGHVYEGENNEPYVISFNYENPGTISRNRVNAVEIRIYERIRYGTSAYPMMVWRALGENPQTQAQIARTIEQTWNTMIDRKAIGRHLQLLQDLGYPVQHGLEGYCCKGEAGAPKSGIQFSPSAYPLLILRVLDGTPRTQTAIIRAVQDRYGVKIDRKAVGRHLELLKSLGFDLLQKGKDGNCLNK